MTAFLKNALDQRLTPGHRVLNCPVSLLFRQVGHGFAARAVSELIANLAEVRVQDVLFPDIDKSQPVPLNNEVVDVVASPLFSAARPALVVGDDLDYAFSAFAA